jgi:CHASE3 domain sensor protein
MTREDQILQQLQAISKVLQDRSDILPRMEYEKRHEQLLINQSLLQKKADDLDQRLIKVEEKGKFMEDDIREIKTDLKNTREELLKNQRQGFQRTIALQGAILLAIITALIAYFFQFLPHH